MPVAKQIDKSKLINAVSIFDRSIEPQIVTIATNAMFMLFLIQMNIVAMVILADHRPNIENGIIISNI